MVKGFARHASWAIVRMIMRHSGPSIARQDAVVRARVYQKRGCLVCVVFWGVGREPPRKIDRAPSRAYTE